MSSIIEQSGVDKIGSVYLQSWDELQLKVKAGWLYRGQRQSGWPLQTSLERCWEREQIHADNRLYVEAQLVRDFRRAYHHYAQHVPSADAAIEWLSLMQHHGAPTRLLDFTYSIYIAAYFALEAADSDSAVWAINAPWALAKSVKRYVQAGRTCALELQAPTQERHESVARELLIAGEFSKSVFPITPFRLNERLRTQRGTFMVAGDSRYSFMENLLSLDGHESEEHVLRIIIPEKLRREGIARLDSMNISSTSLFPGLDGYARSLGVFHPAFSPDPYMNYSAGQLRDSK